MEGGFETEVKLADGGKSISWGLHSAHSRRLPCLGVVYRAIDERLKRVVALKVLRFRRLDPAWGQDLLEPKTTAAGTYTITFTGFSGSLTNTATARFTVK